MKRISLFIITTVLLWTGLQAQIFTVSDTTPCFERQRNYFYYTSSGCIIQIISMKLLTPLGPPVFISSGNTLQGR